MDRKHFRGILKKYLQSSATPEEEEVIDTWYAEMGKKNDTSFEEESESVLQEKYWSAIHSHIRGNRVRAMIFWKAIGIAASLLITVMTFLYLGLPEKGRREKLVQVKTAEQEWQEIFNFSTVPRTFILSDGSAVTLEPQTHLTFPLTFSDAERAVHLEGEAFFDVSRDERRPFLVHTKQLITRVLGTSFRVRSFKQDKDVTVAVKTGKVSVSTKVEVEKNVSETNEIILTPNQQIVYDKEQHKLSRMIVEKPQVILPAEEVRRMRFEAAPVTEIFSAIEKAYGVDLVFDSQTFSSCTLTTFISDGDLFNRLDIICKAIGATYALKESQIEINGSGCNSQ